MLHPAYSWRIIQAYALARLDQVNNTPNAHTTIATRDHPRETR
jgi:hypothetical protein